MAELSKAERLYITNFREKKTAKELAKELDLTTKEVRDFIKTLPKAEKEVVKSDSKAKSIPEAAGFSTHDSGAVSMNAERSTKDDQVASSAMNKSEYLRLNKDKLHVINPNLPVN